MLGQTNPDLRSHASFSVVVPCYNEAKSLPILLEALLPALELATQGNWELILVDDGSVDGTAIAIQIANECDARVKGLILARNFGHQPALSAGLAHASGDFVGIMDCDMQDPVSVLVSMYEKCRTEPLDVCFGVRRKRDAPLLLRVGYKTFYQLMRLAAEHPYPLDAGDFCVMSAKACSRLLAMPEGVRMIRGLRSWIGLSQGSVAYDRPQRSAGESKYNLFKLTALAMRSLVSFSSLPLRLASLAGIFMAGLTLVIGGLFLINRLFPDFTLLGYWVGANPGITTLVLYISLIASMQFFCIGIIGEYLGLVVKEVKQRPVAVIGTIVGEPRRMPVSYPLL